jgi:hypothetical protein
MNINLKEIHSYFPILEEINITAKNDVFFVLLICKKMLRVTS